MQSVAQMFDLALQYQQAGNLHQAESLYRQILQIDPQHVNSWHLLGLVAYYAGRGDLAIDYIRQALHLHPNFPTAHNNIGNIFKALRRFDEAVHHYREALRLQPDYAEAYNNYGCTLKDMGGIDEAIQHFQQAVRLKPDYAEAYSNMGNALREQRKWVEAIGCYQHALRLKPAYAEAYSNLGNVLQDQGKLDEAVGFFQHALRLKPDYFEGYNNLGAALRHQEKYDEAIAHIQHALKLKPDYADGHNNMGIALREKGNAEEAIASCREALRLKPDHAEAYGNLANALEDQGKLDEALASFDKALRLKPGHADFHFNRSMQLLMVGNYAEGWEEYEYRWRSRPFLDKGCIRSSLSPKEWEGSPPVGRTILLHAEQGLGDTIQFVRYAALLKEKGAGKVVLACPPELHRLMGRCQGVDQVSLMDPLPSYDVGAFLLSMPRLMGTTSVERIPGKVPYLDCDPEWVKLREERLAALEERRPALRVGINWQGRPGHKKDRWRSVPLERFAPLAERDGVGLVSLQQGYGSEQLSRMPGLAIRPGDQTDLADTAAIIRCCDLVITVDTAVAHLAGALGVPVWVALPMVPDWRWLLRREDCPWYPTMRLFRQTERGQWDDVFRRIKEALALVLKDGI